METFIYAFRLELRCKGALRDIELGVSIRVNRTTTPVTIGKEAECSDFYYARSSRARPRQHCREKRE